MSIAIYSDVAETIIPHAMVTEYPIYATPKSESGTCYASATGEPIPNMGERRLPLATVEGSLRAMTFQAAQVAKPLGSVDRICEAGHLVVFDSDGSYILNKTTGESIGSAKKMEILCLMYGFHPHHRLIQVYFKERRHLLVGSPSP